ncbi:Pachytene checkpoint protein 2 [Homalodisca vitripennis]|nr:Pachytene checkpoint protein 2 [Homalodisca vitripennis]
MLGSELLFPVLNSLFQSGKLVVKMFDKIKELIEDNNSLVCVLIDEVESLTRARESSMSGSEPSDLIRAVNSVLTQIDQMRKCTIGEPLIKKPAQKQIFEQHSAGGAPLRRGGVASGRSIFLSAV